MMTYYHNWFTGYVTRMRTVTIDPEGRPAVQIELPIRARGETPDLYAARRMYGNAWAMLHAALEFAFADSSICVSIHRHWLDEVRDCIEHDFDYGDLLRAAGSLRRDLAKHDIFTDQKEDCRAVLHSLDDLATALDWLERAEREEYQKLLEEQEDERHLMWKERI